MARQKKTKDRLLTEEEAAEKCGVSLLSFRLWCAAGFDERYSLVDSLAELGRVVGISERSAARWKKLGYVCERPPYCIARAIDARRKQKDGARWFEGQEGLDPSRASGDLARAVLRWVRFHVRQSGGALLADYLEAFADESMPTDTAEGAEFVLACLLEKHFSMFVPTHAEIEEAIRQSWFLV